MKKTKERMKIKNFQSQKAIYYLNEVYKVPFEVLAYAFGVPRITIARIKKKIKEKYKIEEIKEEINIWNLFNKEELFSRMPEFASHFNSNRFFLKNTF